MIVYPDSILFSLHKHMLQEKSKENANLCLCQKKKRWWG